MSGFEAILGSRASLLLAAFCVSWIGVVLLALVAANLHFRLVRVERSRPAADARTPYDHLHGRSLADLLGPDAPSGTRVAFVLSADCPSCDRILAELGEAGAREPVVLLWHDAAPSPPPRLPAGVAVLDGGPQVSRALGVGVTPFALTADASGRVVHAAPVGSLQTLDTILGREGREPSYDRLSSSQPHPPLMEVT